MTVLGMALFGGVLIGLSATWLWWSQGRLAGISGIAAGVAGPDRDWRFAFLGGLVVGGALLSWFAPDVFGVAPGRSLPWLAASGLLVGVGTRMGSGCTSGHGICGLARWSPRSLAATVVFLLVGVATATAIGQLTGGGA